MKNDLYETESIEGVDSSDYFDSKLEKEEGAKRGRKQSEKSIVTVTDTIRILVEDDGVLTVQIVNGEREGEVTWKNDGYFTDWVITIQYVHTLLVNSRILRNSKLNLLELKDIFNETKTYVINLFEKINI
jgi:hypothetical protein